MKKNTTLLDWASLQENAVRSDLSWLNDYRKQSAEFFQKSGLPTQKMEAWKYINTRSFFEKEYSFNSEMTDCANAYKDQIDPSQQRLVFVDGCWDEKLSSIQEKEAIAISEIHEATEEIQGQLKQTIRDENNPLAFLNASRFSKGYVIRIAKEANLLQPLHLYFLSSPGATASLTKTLFDFGSGSNSKVVTHFLGLENNESLMNDFCEAHLARNAKVSWINVQRLRSGNRLFSTFRAYLAESTELKRLSFSNQGDIIRNDESARMLGEQASCTFHGLAFLRKASQVFNEVAVHHLVPHCLSRQTYKNILADQAKSEFNSLSYVYQDAQKSDSGQLNKNLLLSDDARAYSRPKLMIYADDVVANHGSANGQLDKKELFYLLSRGLSKAVAQYVLTLGFAEDILEQIEIESVRIELEDYVKSKIKEMSL